MEPDVLDKETVLEKLRETNAILADADDDLLFEKFNKLFTELMALMCWADDECGNLIQAERTVIYELSKIVSYPQEFEFNHKNVTEVTEGVIRWLTSTGFETITLSNVDSFRNRDKWYLILTQTQVNTINSDCNGFPQLELTYEAGYTDIPDCVYSVIGDIITNTLATQNNALDEESIDMERIALNARLKSRTIGDEKWDWEVSDDSLDKMLLEMKSRGMLKVLGNYNNCFNKLEFAS